MNEPQDVTFWSVVKSVLASLVGVQKRAHLERDFSRGKAWHFIVAGAIGSLLFLLALWLVVRLVLRLAVPS